MTAVVRAGHTRRRTIAAALAAIALPMLVAGCATPRPMGSIAIPGDALAGRLSVRIAAQGGTAERGMSVAFELRGTPTTGELDLSTPLGSMVAQARWAPGQARLITPQGERQYGDLDALSRDALGEVVPLAAMSDWLRGRPWPGAPSQAGTAGFEQLGWAVDTSRQADGQVVARRAAAPAVTVRAALERS